MSIIDETLQNIVCVFEAAFPTRIRGYYLNGSQADGTAVDGSDIDITIVFKENFIAEEASAALNIATSLVTRIKSDIEISDEKTLFADPNPVFKLSSRCIFGTDIREQLPLMPIETWTRDRMHTSYWRIIMLFKRPTPVLLPLYYPDAHDEFYGYVQTEISTTGELSTRNLVRSVTWAATGLVALKAKQYITGKKDVHSMYQRYINDEWAPFIQEIYARCKLAWHYAIPVEKSALRTLCGHTLAFENHFMAEYKTFLIDELETFNATATKQALWIVSHVPFEEPSILAAVDGALKHISTH
jgi:Polymerase beta, Nucleotidyltransferase